MNKPLVSIDIFDTAVFRDVFQPKDIFKEIENKIGNNFYKVRVEAQSSAGAKSAYYNILDIYNLMPKKFNPKDEILEEIKSTRANPYILELYNSKEFDFIFISDMYLPSSVLKVLLEHAGYKNPVVFVSCEERALKATGDLFLKVQDKVGRKIYKHIGDNYNADIKGAKRAKIPEVEYVGPPIYEKAVKTPLLQSRKLMKLLIDKEFDKEVTIEEKVGYLFAPLVFMFTKRVLEKGNSSNTIFFNARDSFLMYVIARWILRTDKNIKYCRFSRKSVHLPNFKTKYKIDDNRNSSSLSFLLTLRVESLRDFLNSLEIKNAGNCGEFLEKYDITLDTDISFYPNKQQIIKGFAVVIQDEIYKKAEEENKNLRRYLENLRMKSGDIFVDLGHYGSMQSIIKEIADIDLIGEYVHLFSTYKGRFRKEVEKTSFLPLGFLKLYTGIVELIFTELKGTVIGYREDGVPVVSNDKKYRKEISKLIIKGVLKGVKEIINKEITVYYNDCLAILERFLEFPTLEEAQFANRDIFENGSLNVNESITWFNEKLIRAGKLKECYNRSYWKPAFKVLMENSDFKALMGEIK